MSRSADLTQACPFSDSATHNLILLIYNLSPSVHAAILALSVATLGIPAIAHGTPQGMSQDENEPGLASLKDSVTADGDKVNLVPDESGKSRDVVNPETLEEHVGHHVEFSAHDCKDKARSTS